MSEQDTVYFTPDGPSHWPQCQWDSLSAYATEHTGELPANERWMEWVLGQSTLAD